jgi:hypothetical protein
VTETNRAPGKAAMPITPFLKGRVFEPNVTRAMGIAFENTCKSLKLVDRSDPLNQIIAMRIIALASSGEHNPDRLYEGALAILKPMAE